MGDEKPENYDSLKSEVETRREELIEEWGEDEYDVIEINEILRDEFNSEEYKQVLIDLDINDEDLGLKEEKADEKITSVNDDEKKENIVQLMFSNNAHIKRIYLKLLGYEEVRGSMRFTGKTLIPKDDVKFMMDVIASLYQPQSLSGKLTKNIKFFDDHYNHILQNFRVRLENYTDDICSARDMRVAIDIFLNEVQVVRSAIMSGRHGDLARDMTIGSYNEKGDNTAAEDKIDKLKKELRL
jgi:hypothetical protein